MNDNEGDYKATTLAEMRARIARLAEALVDVPPSRRGAVLLVALATEISRYPADSRARMLAKATDTLPLMVNMMADNLAAAERTQGPAA